VHYTYTADGNGSTWDTKDDVWEEEAQKYTWTLSKSELTQIHIMEIGGNVPKRYTVTELTQNTLKYQDNFNKSHSFIREKSFDKSLLTGIWSANTLNFKYLPNGAGVKWTTGAKDTAKFNWTVNYTQLTQKFENALPEEGKSHFIINNLTASKFEYADIKNNTYTLTKQ
jgi:hypothetical protein